MNTDKIARYVWIGRKDLYWYHEAQELFTELFGADKLDLVTKLFAATSINTSLKSNITLFRRALHEIENNLPRSKYLPNIEQQIDQIRAGKELTGRKINSFARAMSGDPDAVVVDVWLLRAFDMDKKYFRKTPGTVEVLREGSIRYTDSQGNFFVSTEYNPPAKKGEVKVYDTLTDILDKKRGRFRSGGATNKQYTLIENYVRQEARAMRIQPRQLSALIWSGVRIDQSGDANTHYATILKSHFYNLFSHART